MTDARPYKLFGDSERAALAGAAGAALASWREAWLPAGAQLESECAPAAELGAAATQGALSFSAGERGWWICGDRAALARAVYGAADSGLAGAAGLAAMRELAAALLGGAPSLAEEGSPPAHLFGAGSAASALRLSLGEAELRMVSTPGWTLATLRERLPRPAAAPLDSRRAALAAQPVALEVVAGWVELELGALRGLAPGNVIALGTRIDAPLSVVRRGRGAALFRARLGSRDGSRAIAAVGAR